MRSDVFVQLHWKGELADRLQRLVQLNLTAIQVETFLCQRFGDVSRSDRALEGRDRKGSGAGVGCQLPVLIGVITGVIPSLTTVTEVKEFLQTPLRGREQSRHFALAGVLDVADQGRVLVILR